MGAKLIAHIGMHKTGTTHLQKEVFPKINELADWDLSFTSDIKAKEKWTKNVFLSQEGLSGACMPEKNLISREAGLEKLRTFRKSGYEVRVILTLRAHEDWMRSMFLQKRKKNISYAKYSLDDYAKISLGANLNGYRDLLGELLNYPVLLIDYNYFSQFPDATEQAIFNFSGIEIAKLQNANGKKSTKDILLIEKERKRNRKKKHNISPSHLSQIYCLDFFQLTLKLINKLTTGRINIKHQKARLKLVPIFYSFKIGPTVDKAFRNKDKNILSFYRQDWNFIAKTGITSGTLPSAVTQ
jgi:hypothetical protein